MCLVKVVNFLNVHVYCQERRFDTSHTGFLRDSRSLLTAANELVTFQYVAPLARITYVWHGAGIFAHVQHVIIKFWKRVAQLTLPYNRPLRLTLPLFTPDQLGNSISSNYHSFRKKDKCVREPNSTFPSRFCLYPQKVTCGIAWKILDVRDMTLYGKYFEYYEKFVKYQVLLFTVNDLDEI